MKKRFFKFICSGLSFLFLFSLAANASAAVLAEESKKVSSSKYDLDGDGKKDSLSITFQADEYDYYYAYRIKINKTSSKKIQCFAYANKIELIDIDKKDKYKEIVISFMAENDVQYMRLYRWTGKSIVLLGELDGGRINNSNVKFSGDGNIRTYLRTDILGTFNYYKKYKLQSKSPWIKPIAQSVYQTTDSLTATVIKPFKAYSSPQAKKPDISLKKGAKLTRTGTDANNWVRFKDSNNKTIWIKAASESEDSNYPFYSLIAGYGSMYDYLSGIDFYG